MLVSQTLDQKLITAATQGDLARVAALLEAGADPHAEEDEALFQALMNEHHAVAEHLLFLDLPEMAREAKNLYLRSAETAMAAWEKSLSTNIAADDVHALLKFTLQHNQRGLFRFALARDPDYVKKNALSLCGMLQKSFFLEEILAAGADITRVASDWFHTLVHQGDIEKVKTLIDYGINVNMLEFDMFGEVHCLFQARRIKDPVQKQEMIALLVENGADTRTEGCTFLFDLICEPGGTTTAIELYAYNDPGSDFMSLISHGYRRTPGTPHLSEDALKHFPFLKYWEDRDIFAYFYDPGKASTVKEWAKTLTPEDLARDDGFLFKLAIVCRQSLLCMDALFPLDPPLNTAKDSPLKIATMLNKHGYLKILWERGADIYANDAEALRVPDTIKSPQTAKMLSSLIRREEDAAQEKITRLFPTPPSLQTLRAPLPDTGETGLALAARAGLLRAMAKKNLLADMTSQDLLGQTGYQVSVAGILIARKEYDVLFSPLIWRGEMEGLSRVWDILTPLEKKAAKPHYQHLQGLQSVSRQQAELNQKPSTKLKIQRKKRP